jgi:predicted metal-dependent peptidase
MGREPSRFNIAADLAINPIITDAGYTLPSGGLFPGQAPFEKLPIGLSVEEYYNLLPETKVNDKDDGTGDGIGDPGGAGAIIDPIDEAEAQASAADWQVAVAQAQAVAKSRGTLPAGLERIIGEVLQPSVPWPDALREFVSRAVTAKDDYSWSRPNRRYIAQGLYLPSLYSESIGHVVVAIDTSGSIGQPELDRFAGELSGILEANPAQLTVLYCDANIQHVQEWTPCDGQLTLEARGGGGTSHVPVWNWLKKHGDDDVVCVICLTDGATDFGNDPGLPVMWALTAKAQPPFGRTIQLKG